MKKLKRLMIALVVLTFGISLASCGGEKPLTDEEAITQAKAGVVISGLNAVVKDFTLSAEIIRNEVTISWASDNEDFISVSKVEASTGSYKWNATVVRPALGEEAEEFTLTATFTKNDATDTKVFTGLVLPETQNTVTYTSVATLFAEAKAEDSIEFIGKVYAIADSDGLFVSDGHALVYVYVAKGWKQDGADGIANLAVGATLSVKGSFALYFGTPQIGDVTKITVTENGDGTVPAVDDPSVITLAEIAAHEYTSSLNAEWYGKSYKVTGIVTVTDDKYENPYIISGDNKLSFYYKSPEANIDLIKTHVGKMISLTVTNISRNTTYEGKYNEYYCYVLDGTSIVEGTLTDADKISADKNAVTLETTIMETGTIALPTTGTNGSVISWATDNSDYITADGEVVKVPAVGADEVVVTLTATFTIGDVTDTKEFEITVKAASLDKIEDFRSDLAKDEKDIVSIEGIVYAHAKYGYYLSDGTGYVYVDGTKPEIGTVVKLTNAECTKPFDSFKIKEVDDYVESTATYTMPVAQTVAIADIAAEESSSLEYVAKLVTITGTIKTAKAGKYDSRFITDGTKDILLNYGTSVVNPMDTYTDGQEVTITVVIDSYHGLYGFWIATSLVAPVVD